MTLRHVQRTTVVSNYILHRTAFPLFSHHLRLRVFKYSKIICRANCDVFNEFFEFSLSQYRRRSHGGNTITSCTFATSRNIRNG